MKKKYLWYITDVKNIAARDGDYIFDILIESYEEAELADADADVADAIADVSELLAEVAADAALVAADAAEVDAAVAEPKILST